MQQKINKINLKKKVWFHHTTHLFKPSVGYVGAYGEGCLWQHPASISTVWSAPFHSVCRCIFDAFAGGSEIHILLLCRFDSLPFHSSSIVCCPWMWRAYFDSSFRCCACEAAKKYLNRAEHSSHVESRSWCIGSEAANPEDNLFFIY